MELVTVLIPVGPNYSREWLQEAIGSVINQTHKVEEILFVLDGVENLHISSYVDYAVEWLAPLPGKYGVETWTAFWNNPNLSEYVLPTNVGFRAAFNLGMSVANNELVIYLAHDDKLMPEAVEKAVETWEKNNKKDAWYAFSYIDSKGNKSSIPINAAMTTKHFFLDMCGGFPPAAFVGPDAALMSCLIAHAPDRIIKVADGTPLYWIRDHALQETKTHTWKYVDEMNSIRNKLTKEFKLNE